jgi:NAD-dependent deacetylase
MNQDSIATISASSCAQMIKDSNSITVLTGAGISTAAGIPDFRGPKGLYVTRQYNPESVFDIDHFYRDQTEFYRFTRDFMTVLDQLKPTFTHYFLASLEQHANLSAVITQNIDPLHKQAGSENVISVHGDYYTSHCLTCGKEFSLQQLRDLLQQPENPRCQCNGIIKPDVVFFGEAVKDLDKAQRYVEMSDLLFILGSSLSVYPAAALPQFVSGNIICVNKGPVSLPANNKTFIVSQDLDSYFQQVASILNLPGQES